MRVAIVHFAVKNKILLQNITRGLAQGIQAQGHIVDVIDGMTETDKKLTIYNYIAVGTESTSFFSGKISGKIKEYFANAGTLAGKMSFAYLLKSGFGTEKALLSLMRVMEAQGMIIKTSEVFKDPEIAEIIGKKLHVS